LQCSVAHAKFVTSRGGEIEWYEPGATAAAARAAKLDDFLRGSSVLPPPMGDSSAQQRRNVFFSFDVDAIQGSDMSSVSCPSPVGLPAEEAMRHCESAGSTPDVRLVDMSEFNPAVGDAFRSARLGAMMFYHFCLGRAMTSAGLVSRPTVE